MPEAKSAFGKVIAVNGEKIIHHGSQTTPRSSFNKEIEESEKQFTDPEKRFNKGLYHKKDKKHGLSKIKGRT